MGTRADFYVGRGEQAEWLGSIAWDGYPSGLTDTPILTATSADDFRAAVTAEIARREDGTPPEQGWPWPWDNSGTTDYAYAIDHGKVWASCFGHDWFDPLKEEPDDDEPREKSAVFPDMQAKKRVTFGKRSGVIVIGASGPIAENEDR